MKSSKISSDSSITLFLSGDVMTGRGIDQVLPYSVAPILFEQYVKDARQYVELAEHHSGGIPNNISFDYIWGDALTVLDEMDPDARIINLETAITTSDNHWPMKDIHYRMHPENASLLTEAGIDICVLGNNHTMDWGYNGLKETLRTLHKHNLTTAGAGLDRSSAAAPAIMKTQIGRLLVFSYADVTAGIPISWRARERRPGVNLLVNLAEDGLKQVMEDVKSFRRKGDLVVLSIHWGGNWGYDVPQVQQEFAHRLIEEGLAAVIYGHSSHHPKGIEVYHDRLILYGCGDFINDYEGIAGHEEYRDEISLMYFPKLDRKGLLISLEIIPMKFKKFSLHNTNRKDKKWITTRMNRECKKFGASIERDDRSHLRLRW